MSESDNSGVDAETGSNSKGDSQNVSVQQHGPVTKTQTTVSATASEGVYENVRKTLNINDIKEIAREMIKRLQTQNQFVNRLKLAEEKAGKKGTMLIALRFTIVLEAQIQILEELNVGRGERGLKCFLYHFRKISNYDLEAAKLFKELKSIWFFDMDSSKEKDKDELVIEKAV